jgi:transcriptional regulator GlxA family with amidase domain
VRNNHQCVALALVKLAPAADVSVARLEKVDRPLKLIVQNPVRGIRALRAEQTKGGIAGLVEDQAALARHVILLAHGNVKLHFEIIAEELGVEVRTLERAFKARFGVSMKQSAGETRIQFAQYLLATDPLHKMSSIASLLGYESPQAFIRFFRQHTATTPARWADQQRSRP